jgi:hypothetical protein
MLMMSGVPVQPGVYPGMSMTDAMIADYQGLYQACYPGGALYQLNNA